MSASRNVNRRKWIVFTVVGFVLIALIALALKPQPIPADFSTASRGDLRVTIDEEGETRVRHRFMVSAPVAGRVLRIELEPGDPVIAGETVLARFQPSAPTPLDARSRAEAEARVGAAEAAQGFAEAESERLLAELDFAKSELRRAERLAAEEIVSKERLESAQLNVRTKEEALRSAEFSIRNAEKDLQAAQARLLNVESRVEDQRGDPSDPISLRSPIDGRVLQRLRESESVVPAGDPLIEIGDPSRLEIISDLLSTDAVQVRPGQTVLVEEWGGDNPLNGRVRRVEPFGFTKFSALGVEEQRVNVLIHLTDPRERWESLGDGYRVEVRIVIWENNDVLKIPTSSLFRHGEEWAVFVAAEGVAHLRTIKLGERNGLEAQVLDGLAAGDQVIVHPSDQIEDGVEVEERDV